MCLHHISDFAQRIENAGAGFAMDDEDVGDVRIVPEQGVDFLGLGRQVIALVQGDEGATEVFQGLGGALAVGAIHQHQCLAVTRDGSGQGRFHRVAAAALQRHAGEAVIRYTGHAQQVLANLGRDLIEGNVP
ncbi:hypothetical protein D9M71_764920 [compost metagenome]